MNNIFSLLKIIYKVHKPWVILWTLLNIILYIVVVFFMPLKASTEIQIFALVGFGLLYTALIVALGDFFGIKNTKSWVRQLPFSEFSLTVVPHILIFLYGVFSFVSFYDLWKSAFYLQGFPSTIAIFFAPFLMFGILRLMRSLAIGIAISGLILLTLFMLLIFLGQYINIYWELECQLIVIALTILSIIFLHKENIKYTFPIIGLILMFIGGVTAYEFNYKAKDFQDSVITISFYPSSNAIKNFKTYALDSSLWQHQEVKRCKRNFEFSYASLKGGYFANAFMSASEQLQYVKNITTFSDNFECTYSEEEDDSNFYYPFYTSDMINKKEIQEYLLSHWEDKRVFCELLPYPIEVIGNKKIIEGKCGPIFSFKYISKYNPNRNSEEDKAIENFLLTSHTIKSSKTKESIARNFTLEANWGKNELFTSSWLDRHPLTAQQLNLWKKDFKKENIERIKSWKQLSKSDYKKSLLEFIEFNNDEYDFYKVTELMYFYQQLYHTRDAPTPSLKEHRSLNTFIKKIKGRNFDEQLYERYNQLTTDESWEKLQQLKI